MVLLIYLVVVVLLISNLPYTLLVGALASIPLTVIDLFNKRINKSLKNSLIIIVVVVALFSSAYRASINYADAWVHLYFEGQSVTDEEDFVNEYWNRIFTAPFFPKDCYSSERTCERWNFKFGKHTFEPQTPYSTYSSNYYDRVIPLGDRITAFTSSLGFGILAILVGHGLRVGVRKVIRVKHLWEGQK